MYYIFMRKHKYGYLHLVLFLDTEMRQAIEIHPQENLQLLNFA